MTASLFTCEPTNVRAVFDLLTEAVKFFNPEKPEESCAMMAEDIYFILGKACFSKEEHIPFLEKIIAEREEESIILFGALETFFRFAQTHIYLLNHEKGQNTNPLITQANVLSSLFHFLTEIFRLRSKEMQTEENLRLFDTPDGFRRFISLLNSAEINGFRRHEFHLYRFDLRDAYLAYSDLGNADLRSADLTRADLRNANLGAADLSGAVMEWANLSSANMKGSCPRGANLSRADLRDANLSEANLKYAHLSGANLSGANLSNTDLSHADLGDSDLRGANLTNANLTGTYLRDADLSVANLVGAYLMGADMIGADLTGANLVDARLTGASLVGANLKDANLSGADMKDANLKDADMREARELTCEQIESAIIGERTRMPEYSKVKLK